jgi:hypothetical protein
VVHPADPALASRRSRSINADVDASWPRQAASVISV